jgi:hypothetical protein
MLVGLRPAEEVEWVLHTASFNVHVIAHIRYQRKVVFASCLQLCFWISGESSGV